MDYALEFCTLAADRGWNQLALVDTFIDRLSKTLKDQLTPLDLPTELDALVSLASCIDQRMTDRRRNCASSPPCHQEHHSLFGRSLPPRHECPSSDDAPRSDYQEPKQIGNTHLSPEESQH